MHVRRLSGPAGLAVVLILVAAGCGNDPAAAPGNGNPGPAGGGATTAAGANPSKVDNNAPACPASSQVGSKLAISVDGNADEVRSNPRVNCTYKGRRLSDNGVTSVFISLDGLSGPGPFADFRKQAVDRGNVLSERAGLGDGAFTWSTQVLGSTVNNLVTYKGSLRIYIGAEATLDQEANLAMAIFG